MKAGEFHKVFEKVGETGIISLVIKNDLSSGRSAKDSSSAEASAKDEKKPVLVKNIQIHPVTDEPLHIDFYQVNLSEKVKVNVPLEITGESPAVEKKIGLLLTPISELEIEALPTDLPENIEVDISNLNEIDDEIKVKDLKVDRSKIEVLTDEELVVVQIGELVTKEMEAVEAEMEAEAAEAQAEAAPAEGEEAAEGEAAAEGEVPATGGEKAETPKEEKPQE